MSSHFLHLQRTALVYLRGMLIGMGGARVACAHAACRCSGVALVVSDELLEREGFAGVAHDALHDALATDGAIVGYVVVHA